MEAERASQLSHRSLERHREAGASRRTVLIALGANATVAIMKLFGGLASGSTAMLAEAAHSVADTTNQAFLLVSIKLGRRDPTPAQPFGYGQERFLWTFMAAVGMFLAGATFAIGYGAYELVSGGGEQGGFAIAYAVLAASFIAEGLSWVRALRQTRSEAREAGLPFLRYTRSSRDPNVKMILLEDTAALVGVALATIGVALHQLTGSPAWDASAAVVIGLLLVSVAIFMGRDAKHLLVGAAARPEERETIERTIEEFDEIEEVVQLLTMALGPNALLVAARVDLADDLDSERIEEISTGIERSLREAVPDVTEVFLDATPGREPREVSSAAAEPA
jgi:cation diffusion facilitator family transporter